MFIFSFFNLSPFVVLIIAIEDGKLRETYICSLTFCHPSLYDNFRYNYDDLER